MIERGVQDRRLLVVEDDYFWAEELSSGLRRAGAVVLGPVGSVGETLALLRAEPEPDAAILDMNLRGEPSTPIADWLRARRVPLLILTGYEPDALPEAYVGLPRLEKPVTLAGVLSELGRLLPGGREPRRVSEPEYSGDREQRVKSSAGISQGSALDPQKGSPF